MKIYNTYLNGCHEIDEEDKSNTKGTFNVIYVKPFECMKLITKIFAPYNIVIHLIKITKIFFHLGVLQYAFITTEIYDVLFH